MQLTVPAAVRAKARLAGAEDWLVKLPDLVTALEREWSITAGEAYPDATEAFVARATSIDGSPCVLKLLVPRHSAAAAYEITALRLARGRGCVALLREDAARGALLLEGLGPSMADTGLAYADRLPVLADLAATVWQPAPGAPLPSGADKGRWLIDHLTRLRGDCDFQTFTYAVTCAERRIAAHDDARAVLVHGDVHQWNVLRAGDGWKLVDPDGLLAEPEYDLGVLMREDPAELMSGDPWERAHWLAERTGTDATAIWEWGVVERLSTGLLLRALGMDLGAEMLAAARRISRDAGSAR